MLFQSFLTNKCSCILYDLFYEASNPYLKLVEVPTVFSKKKKYSSHYSIENAELNM
jgi:hypothetical protein